MKKYIKIFGLAIAAVFTAPTNAQDHDIYKNIEFKMPQVKETNFPNRVVSIEQYGAKSGGIVKNTEAFRKAIVETNQKVAEKLQYQEESG